MFRGGAAWRERLTDAIGDQGPVSALLSRRSDEDLATLADRKKRLEAETLEVQAERNTLAAARRQSGLGA